MLNVCFFVIYHLVFVLVMLSMAMVTLARTLLWCIQRLHYTSTRDDVWRLGLWFTRHEVVQDAGTYPRIGCCILLLLEG